jgi:hypothetical protein
VCVCSLHIYTYTHVHTCTVSCLIVIHCNLFKILGDWGKSQKSLRIVYNQSEILVTVKCSTCPNHYTKMFTSVSSCSVILIPVITAQFLSHFQRKTASGSNSKVRSYNIDNREICSGLNPPCTCSRERIHKKVLVICSLSSTDNVRIEALNVCSQLILARYLTLFLNKKNS